MPGDNLFISNWQKEFTSLQNHWNEWRPVSSEDIHKIRIHIKKIRAYLKLYLLISDRKDDKELLKETEVLFAVLGEHRNLELCKVRAKELFQNNPALGRTFMQWLEFLQAELDIENILKNYDLKHLDRPGKMIKEFMMEWSDEKLRDKIRAIQQHYFRKIQRQMHHFSHHAHRIRKELKIIFYLYKISLTGQASSELLIKQLEKILDLLGKIQDDEVAIILIQRFYDRLYLKQDKKFLAGLVKNIRVEKEEILNRVQKKLSIFLHQSCLLSPTC